MNGRPGSEPSVGQASPSPFAGQRFGLERPTGSRGVRGPTAFVLGAMSLIAIAAMVRTLLT
jgi:hypothetical protein